VSPPVQLTDVREGEGGGVGAELYNRKKAWPSINRSILSGTYPRQIHFYVKIKT